MANDKFKFRVGEKAIIEVEGEHLSKPAKPRRGALDYIEPEYPGRRKGGPLIRFYDLGQVNHQALGDTPVWVDHPILKTPSYTTSADVSAVDFFQGVIYSIDPFVDADYQAYTDMMFNYPVTEWTQRYKRIEFPNTAATLTDFDTDARLSMVDTGMTSIDEFFCASYSILKGVTGDYPGTKSEHLATSHWVYDLDRNVALFRGLDALKLNNSASTSLPESNITPGYFGMDTADKTRFKVTTTNDSSAADVGDLAIAGNIDAFLMPQVSFTLATSNSSDWKTTEVLGLCYQVNPRHLWPLYVAPNTSNGAGQHGTDLNVSNYLNYLKARSGVQMSVWSFTGAVNTPFDYSFSASSESPSTFTGQNSWAMANNGGGGNSYYGMFTRGGPILDGQTSYATTIEANTTDDNYGIFELFRNYSPFLSCVFRMGGQFYYVWDISGGAVDSEGNYTVDQTAGQGIRYRINRNVNWDGDFIQTVPAVRDGSGAQWDLQNDFP
jgi:hypothetical protein